MLYEVDTIDICTTYSITVSLSLLPIPNTNLVHSFHCCHKQLLVRVSAAAVAVAVETTTTTITITVATWYILLHIWMTMMMTMMINIMKVQCNNGCCSSNIMNNTNNIHRGNTCTTQLSLQSSLRKEHRTSNLAPLARLSPNYKLEIMNALQVTVDNNTAERFLLSEVDRKQYLSEWRRSTQYKQRKALARKRNREANKNRPTMENQWK